MTKIIYLVPGENFPMLPETWVTVEGVCDGCFRAEGLGVSLDGRQEQYRSDPADEASLGKAISAALSWAQDHDVPTIWVRDGPTAR